MKNFFSTIHINHKNAWNKENLLSLLFGVILFVIALILQKFANDYLLSLKGVVVDDLILKNIPVIDLDFFIVQGALILTAVIVILFLIKPKYLFFGLKALAMFIIVRSFFIVLTHLGTMPSQIVLDKNSIGFNLYNMIFNSSNDFFFSGHTGLPFLMALIFWPEKFWRYFFIGTSIILGASVLLTHFHYSIDVFAAPFITYTLFVATKYFFKKDFAITQEVQNTN
jgi:hypothetical protein